MAKTLTIAGVDFLPQYKTNSAYIRELIQNKSSVMNMQIVVIPANGDSVPLQGSEIIFKDGARFLFGGYITRVKPTEIGEGQMFIYDIEASDYSWIFNNKVARRTYTNQTLEYIVEDLLDTYLDAGYGFTDTNVAVGPTIQSITFDHVSLRKCFEKLQKLTGYIWYVDYEKNVYFTTTTAEAAPEDIRETTDNFEDVSIAYDTSQVRNSVIVIGSPDGQQSAETTVETFYGDGETRAWELQAKPSNVISIKLNTVSQQFSLDVNERDTDYFVYSFSGQSFRLTDAQTTPVGGGTPDEIEITYNPRVPIIVLEQDGPSIDFFSDLDGGDGLFELTIKDSSITTQEEATDRALRELEEFAMPLVNGEFRTRTSLLGASSIFAPGQYLTVNLPTHGISTDSAFLIQEVNIELVEDEGTGTTEYKYTVRFGGKLVGVQEFLESLASEEGDISDSDVVITIESVSDGFDLDDAGAAASHTLYTPPFEYGAAGSPQAVWNMSEW